MLTESGRPAADVPQPSLADYLALAVDEIAHWGTDVERVQQRLAVMLRDLKDAAAPQHQVAVREAVASFTARDRDPRARPDPEPTDTGLR